MSAPGAKAPYFRIYKDTAGEFRWTFYASNGKKVADSAEGYKNKLDCTNGLNLVKSFAATATVQDATATPSMNDILRNLGKPKS